MRSRVCGLTVTSFFCSPRSRHRGEIPGYPYISALLPAKIESIQCKGKLIYFTFRSLDKNKEVQNNIEFFLTSHLAMSGRWCWKNEGHSDVGMKLRSSSQNSQTEYTLYYDDARHFGTLHFYNTRKELDSKLSELGPDVLATAIMYSGGPTILDPLTPSVWFNKLENSRIKNKQICVFLLEQKHTSGCGNYIRVELLYRARIRPDRLLCQLSYNDKCVLYRVMLETVLEAYKYGGLTLETYWSPEGQIGKFPRQVYKKKADPFGNEVITTTFKDGRTMHWCPAIQI